MKINDVAITPQICFLDTKPNILAFPNPIQGMEAITTDTGEKGIYNGTVWKWRPLEVLGGSSHVIQEEGTPLTARENLNFVGMGVVASDDAGNDATIVTVSGAYDPSGSAAAAQAAAQSYADGLVTGLWDDRGTFDASVNAYPSSGGSGVAGAILKGDIWTISVAGTLPTGQVVEIGDNVRALIDTPGNTQANWAIAQQNIGYVAENAANKVTSLSGASTDVQYPSAKLVYDQLALKATIFYLESSLTLKEDVANRDAADGYVGKSSEKINIWNAARTYMSLLESVSTAPRTYTLPNKSMVIAGVDDKPPLFYSGGTIANNATDPTNDINFSVTKVRDSTNAENIDVAALIKKLDASWVVGTNQGMLDTGSKANSTQYNLFAIKRSDSGVTDYIASTSATPALPANYDYYRFMHSIWTDASGVIRPFYNYKNRMTLCKAVVYSLSGGTATSPTNFTLSDVPTGRKLLIIGSAQVTSTSGVSRLFMCDPDADRVAGIDSYAAYGAAANLIGISQVQYYCDTSARLRYYVSGTGATAYFGMISWEELREI